MPAGAGDADRPEWGGLMVALVSVETVLLVLLIVLVAGLLRSHAELLRRLGPGEAETEASRARSGSPLPDPVAVRRAPPGSGPGQTAPAIAGSTPSRDAVSLDFGGGASGPTLLAFLSTGCASCAAFWESLGEPRLPAEVQTVIVTRGPERERLGKVRELAPAEVPVVMSTQSWKDYRVPGSPYFVLVDRDVRGEGAATSWPALASLVTDAIEDERSRDPASPPGSRQRRVEETFAAAGIGPDHASLRPGRPRAGPLADDDMGA